MISAGGIHVPLREETNQDNGSGQTLEAKGWKK
jgi:hypothetical protein